MRGLRNLGSTCYLNAALWALIPVEGFFQNAEPFMQVLQSALAPGDGPAVDTAQLFTQLAQRCKLFRERHVQHDAHDALLEILDMLGPPDTFRGEVQTVIKDSKGNKRFAAKEDFTVLTIPIAGCQTLAECTKTAFQKEEVELEGAQVTKWTKFLTAPQVLLIHFNRFDPATGSVDNATIEYTQQIDIRFSNTLTRYELYYVCGHVGDTGGGHYTAIVRQGATWYLVDDHKVYRVIDNSKVFNLSGAYMLGYFKVNAQCQLKSGSP